MNTKLTISLNHEIIARAKSYAKMNHTSLSALVEHYFRYLTGQQEKKDKTLSPLVRELSGIIDLPEDFDSKNGYREYITKKYS